MYRSSSSKCKYFVHLIDICKNILSKPKLIMVKQCCLCYCFMIMEIFNKAFTESEKEGIDFGLLYLNKLLNPRPVDAFLDAKLTICCISYLWQCIKSNNDNLQHFVSSKGVYLLLDIIEVNDFLLRNHPHKTR